MNSQFNKLSIDLTKKLSVKDKKDNGIYFTPMDIVKLTIDSLINMYLLFQYLSQYQQNRIDTQILIYQQLLFFAASFS